MSNIIFYQGKNREVGWDELNQLKKDILWIYNENYGQINAAYVPSTSFQLKYHEYLFLSVDLDEYDFYIDGVLITLLAVCIEYIDTNGGDREPLTSLSIQNVMDAVEEFTPKSNIQKQLKARVLLGLEIAITLTERDLITSDLDLSTKHTGVTLFYDGINVLADTVMKAYFKSKNT